MGVVTLIELCFDPNVGLLYGKTRLRRVFWRVRAEIKRQVKSRRRRSELHKKSFGFNYDPFSYALNFDDGNFGFFC
ncbi:hypothetical protein TorRG33x02_164190 [Trema orientale]|uniref:Uncharacterized protein n=1 Tax=Trema orientale TaxID=63057 RepID=A0A2P5EQ99_TREOI|nr:hypothetical protein TorRG33x02_164190 [Trema orientale]